MTRKEANQSILNEAWGLGTILKTTFEVFFENIPKWLILGAVIAFPVSFLISYISTFIPVPDLNAVLANITVQGPEGLAEIDWSPFYLRLLIQFVSTFFFVLFEVSVCIYTDTWLQVNKPEPTVSELLSKALKRWPAVILTLLLFAGAVLAAALLSAFLMMFVGFLLIFLVLGGILIYQFSLTSASIRGKKAVSAVRYAIDILKKKPGSTILIVLVVTLIQFLMTTLINQAASALLFRQGQEFAFSLVSGLFSVIGELPTAFSIIAITLHFVNTEQHRFI